MPVLVPVQGYLSVSDALFATEIKDPPPLASDWVRSKGREQWPIRNKLLLSVINKPLVVHVGLRLEYVQRSSRLESFSPSAK